MATYTIWLAADRGPDQFNVPAERLDISAASAHMTLKALLAHITEYRMNSHPKQVSPALGPAAEVVSDLGPAAARVYRANRQRVKKSGAVQRVFDGVENGSVRVFVDDQQVQDLTHLVDLSSEPRLMLVQLVELRGSPW